MLVLKLATSPKIILLNTILWLTVGLAHGKTMQVLPQIDAKFQQAVSASTVPGISVAIADNTGVVWANGYGLADIENQVTMTPKHKMRIGSVAKLITVAAMMRLLEQQKIDLDRGITEYVSVWPTKHAPLTLRQLASHTAGIRHYNNSDEFLMNQHFADVSSSLTIFKDDNLLFKPGDKTQYSTFAFSLIAAALEGANSPLNFKQIVQQQVFAPLGMQDSVFDDQADIIAFRQRPYNTIDGKLFNAPQTDHSYKYAGGGFLATASDISRFAVAHASPGYLQAESLSQLFSPTKLNDGSTNGFGIGWMINFDSFKRRSYYQDNSRAQQLMASFDNAAMHAGGSNGGTTMMILCRDHQRAVTVVKNVDGEHSADVFLLALETLSHFHKL
ncbi:serine hydrolase domain-containing protein [Aliiglaciecola sp. LCG003]|uniref:serine hydrolase domain-containing protein n=1 Tax=Aliiglaciecola sp. LCG003 TaxID=3053655 RepID=UPI0025746631|nr:serine hydrolase domain-containing protein [Aliiglaciecola sp. LCG003]WJG08821.1 serine hydrolase domain-containing protein [Aliiglaciecola sp. LCG003]